MIAKASQPGGISFRQLLFSILLAAIWAFLGPGACAPIVPGLQPTASPPSGPAPTDPPGETELEDFILRELAGAEPAHRYVAQVTTLDPRAPLPTTRDAIGQCWLYRDGSLGSCTADDFVGALAAEGTGPWKYSYVVFAVTAYDPAAGTAAVRLDEIAGIRAGHGLLYTLARKEGIWQIESSENVWTS